MNKIVSKYLVGLPRVDQPPVREWLLNINIMILTRYGNKQRQQNGADRDAGTPRQGHGNCGQETHHFGAFFGEGRWTLGPDEVC